MWSVLVSLLFRTHVTATYVVCLQELILEKVREDMVVRTKISQSSALRQKRGHTVVNQPESTETEAPVGLNNNGPYSQTEKNGLVYANGTMGEPENILDKMEDLKISRSTDNEEESLSTDSLSEVSKFES